MVGPGAAPNPTRVLFVTAAKQRGGAEDTIEQIVGHLDRRRFEPVLAAPASGRLLDRWRDRGWTVVGLPSGGGLYRLDRRVHVVAVLSAAITHHEIDIVHAHGVIAQIHAGVAARWSHRRSVFHVPDIFDTRWSVDAMLQRLALRAPSDAVIAISDAVAAALPRRVRPKMHVIPLAADRAIVEPVDWTRGKPIPAATPLVVWCGRLQRWKGAHLFLDAAATIHAARPDVRFAIVGGTVFGREPCYAEELRRQAAGLGLSDVVEFTGQVDDARAWMRAASVVIHSSARPEPFGLVMVEAMMQERPVVGFRQGGAAEIVADGETGRLVPVSDTRAMAAATLSLLQDDAVRLAMGRAGRERALARFEAGLMTRAIEQVYDRVAAACPQAPRVPL